MSQAENIRSGHVSPDNRHGRSMIFCNRSQSICRIVSVYRVLQMQGGGHADVLMYFKCPPTQQVQYPVNGYDFLYETPTKAL